MPNLNKVMLIGNLTRDPEMRPTQSGTPIASIGIAVNRRWKSKAGESQSETTFVDCDFFGKTAEIIGEYFRKGNPIFIEGRLKLDQWTDKDGGSRSKMKVIGDNFEFLQSKSGGQSSSKPPSNPKKQDQAKAEDLFDGDIPF